MAFAVLIIEDERVLAKNLTTYLAREGYEAEAVESGREGLARIDSFHPDMVLLDYSLPDMNGLEVLAALRASRNRTKVIMITGHGSIEVAVQAMKEGAYDYLSKPVALGEIKLLLDKACKSERLEGALSYYLGREARESGLAKLAGNSPPMVATKEMIPDWPEHALIDGEPRRADYRRDRPARNGGASVALRRAAPRAPFVEINCASIPDRCSRRSCSQRRVLSPMRGSASSRRTVTAARHSTKRRSSRPHASEAAQAARGQDVRRVVACASTR